MKITITVGETSRSMDMAQLAEAINEPRVGDMTAHEVAGAELANLFTAALDGEWTRVKQTVAEAYAVLHAVTGVE